MNRSDKIIFIIGYSRSGTKMMSDLLEKTGLILRPPEIHFFGGLYNPKNEMDLLPIKRTLKHISNIQEKGLHYSYPLSKAEITTIVEKRFNNNKTAPAVEIYLSYFSYLISKYNKHLFLDATPRNIYYLDYLLKTFPQARFIYMLRDPRDNALSQKVKYKKYINRNKLEALRLFFNYHPYNVAKMWKNSLKNYKKNRNDKVKLVRYEDLTSQPEKELKEVFDFLKVPYNSEIAASIRKNNTNKWQRGLKKWEISLLEKRLHTEI